MLLISIINNNIYTNSFPIFIEFQKDIKTFLLLSNSKEIIYSYKNYIDFFNLDIEFVSYLLNDDKFNNVNLIHNEIKKICNNFERVYFNTSNSDSIYSILLGSIVLENNGSIISYNKDNTIDIIYNNNYEKLDIRHNANLIEHLTLNNFNLLSSANDNEIYTRKDTIINLFHNEARIKNYIKFKKSWETDLFKFNDYYNKIIMTNLSSIDKLNTMYINGLIFEEYIYILLKELNIFDDIKCNVILQKNNVENEIDILAIKNNKIYSIECKFRDNSNRESNNFIYRSNTTHNLMDNDGSGIIISLSNTTNFTENTFQRAELSNVFILENNFISKDMLLSFFTNILKGE